MKDSSMQASQSSPADTAQVEKDALRAEAFEAEAKQRFDAARVELVRAGGGDETQLPELRSWLAARVQTDAAWGRWALAVDPSLAG
jgi:hypothetical protein